MEEYKIALEAIIDPASLTNLQTQLKNANIKPIPIVLDTTKVEAQIKSIRSQIEALKNIKIDFGAGRSRNGSVNVSQTTAAYKELLSIASQIDKLSLKTGGMKFNGGDIKNAEQELANLRSRYDELYQELSTKSLDKAGFKKFRTQISGVKADLTSLEAELIKTQSQMATGIKSNIANGTLGSQVAEVERKFIALGVESKEVTANITTLRTLLSSMDSSDDIESVVADYEVFKQTLATVTNQVKTLKATGETTQLINARTTLSSDIDVWLQNNSAAAKTFGAQLQNIKSQIASADKTTLTNLRAQFVDLTKQAKLAGVAGLSMGDQFKRSLRTVSSYFSAAMLITRAISVMRNMYNEVLKVDTAMTGLKRVTNLTADEYENLYSKMTKSAKEYGATLDDIISSTASWVRLGFDANTAEKLSEITSMYQHVTDLDYDTAVTNLVTAYKGYQEQLMALNNNDSVKAMNQIADIYDKLGNEMPVTAAQVGEGMTKAASVLEMSGATIQQAAGMITGGGSVTQDFSAFGNALRVSALRIRGMKGELEELGEEVDDNIVSVSKMQTQILNLTNGKVNIFEADGETFRNIYDIYADIAEIYDELSDTDRASLLELLAGKVRSNQIQGMLKNWSDVEEATKKAYEAEGTAAQENERYMASMQGKINATKAAWQDLANTFLSSDFLKGLIDSGRTFLEIINNIVKTTGTLPALLAIIFGYFSAKKNLGIITTINSGTTGIVNNLRIWKANLVDIKAEYDAIYASSRAGSGIGSSKIASGVKGTWSAFKTAKSGLTSADIDALKNYNAQLDLGVSKQTAFNRTLLGASENAQKMAESAKYGKVNLNNLKTSSDGLKGSLIGTRIAATALNAVLSMGIALAVSFVIEQFQKWTQAMRTASEEADTLAQKQKEESQNAKQEVETLEELISKYKELKKNDITDSGTRDEIKKIQEQITSLVGKEANNLDLVNGKLDDQIVKLYTINQELRDQEVEKAIEAYHSASNASNKALGKQESGWLNYEFHIDNGADERDFVSQLPIWMKNGIIQGNTYNLEEFIDLENPFTQRTIKAQWDIDTSDIEGKIEALNRIVDELSKYEGYASSEVYNQLIDSRNHYQEYLDSENSAAIDLLNAVISQQEGIERIQGNTVNNYDDYLKYRQTIIDNVSQSGDISEALNNGDILDTDIEKYVDNYLSGLSDFNDYYNQWVKEFKDTTDNSAPIVKKSFSDLISDEDFKEKIDNYKDKITELDNALEDLRNGDLSEEAKIELFENFPELAGQADDLDNAIVNLINDFENDAIKDFNDQLDYMDTDDDVDALNSLRDSILGLATTKSGVSSLNDEISKLKSTLDDLSNTYSDIQDIIEDYNDNGYLTLDNLQSIMDLEPEYINLLINENGQINLNNQAYKDYVASKAKSLLVSELKDLYSSVLSMKVEEVQAYANAKAYDEETDSVKDLLTATTQLYYAQAMAKDSANNTTVYTEALKRSFSTAANYAAMVDSYINSLNTTQNEFSTTTNETTSALEAQKDALEDEKDALEDYKDSLEDAKDALEDYKDELENAQDSLQSLIDLTIDYIKQLKEDEKKALEDQIDALDKQKDALDESKDKYAEIIDAKKEALKLVKEEKEAADELSDKQKSVAKNRLALEVAGLDDSSAGKKAYKQAKDNLADSEKDLSDYLADQSYEKQVAELEDLQEKFEESIEKRKVAIDNQVEYINSKIDEIDAYLDNSRKLYEDACAMIDSDTGELYNNLWNYTYQYTTKTHAEFDYMWNSAQTALRNYQGDNETLMSVMERLQQKIYDTDEEIADLSLQIDDCETQIGYLDDAISNTSDAINNTSSAIDNVSNSIGGLASNIQDYKKALEELANANTNDGIPANAKWTFDFVKDGEVRTAWSTSNDFETAVRDIQSVIEKETGYYRPDVFGGIKKRYASGTRHTPSAYISQDGGLEAVFAKNPNGDGMYTLTTPDSQVFDHERTDELYNFSGDPEGYLTKLAERGLTPLSSDELNAIGWGSLFSALGFGQSNFDGSTIAKYISNSGSHVYNNDNNASNNNYTVNMPIQIQGNADQAVIQLLNKYKGTFTKEIISELTRIGEKFRR